MIRDVHYGSRIRKPDQWVKKSTGSPGAGSATLQMSLFFLFIYFMLGGGHALLVTKIYIHERSGWVGMWARGCIYFITSMIRPPLFRFTFIYKRKFGFFTMLCVDFFFLQASSARYKQKLSIDADSTPLTFTEIFGPLGELTRCGWGRGGSRLQAAPPPVGDGLEGALPRDVEGLPAPPLLLLLLPLPALPLLRFLLLPADRAGGRGLRLTACHPCRFPYRKQNKIQNCAAKQSNKCRLFIQEIKKNLCRPFPCKTRNKSKSCILYIASHSWKNWSRLTP